MYSHTKITKQRPCHADDLTDETIEARVTEFIEKYVEAWHENGYLSNNMMITMGDDFTYQEAEPYFKNLDFLINAINSLESTRDKYNAVYSTPACYYNAVTQEISLGSLTEKSGDFFPYCDGNFRPYEPTTGNMHDYITVVHFFRLDRFDFRQIGRK